MATLLKFYVANILPNAVARMDISGYESSKRERTRERERGRGHGQGHGQGHGRGHGHRHYYITLSAFENAAFQTPPTPKVTSGASTVTCSQPALARRLATQQVGYDQKRKSAVQRRKLQQHSQYPFLDGAP